MIKLGMSKLSQLFDLAPLADHGLRLIWRAAAPIASVAVVRQMRALRQQFQSAPDAVRGQFFTPVLSFDALTLRLKPGALASTAFGELQRWLETTEELELDAAADADTRIITVQLVPFPSDSEYAADLQDVAHAAGLAATEVLHLFCAGTYWVTHLGFRPGFPYMLGLDSRLNVPRRSTPRAQVPAGSVAIAENMVGVYPQSSPGGWNLLGVARAELFDVRRTPPALLQAGQGVRYELT